MGECSSGMLHTERAMPEPSHRRAKMGAVSRIASYIFSGFAALSLLLCAGTSWLWAAGYVSVEDVLLRKAPSLARRLAVGPGIRGLHDPKAPAWDWLANAVPLWAIALSTALPPYLVARAIMRQRRERRRLHAEARLCQRCGYDLRATPQRCPECGTVPRTVPR